MNNLLILPVLIPLLFMGLLILLMRSPLLQRAVSLCGAAALLIASLVLLQQVHEKGILVLQVGNWPAPFGISFVADNLAAIMVAVSGFVGLMVVIFSFSEIDEGRLKHGFHPLLHLLLAGVCGAFLTGDLFNLFVWFEVMLMASFILLALGGEREQLGGAVKYLLLNFLSSGLFLTALGLLYGKVGTLNMADLAQKLDASGSPGLVLTTSMLLLVSFGIKAGIFPLFSWLPASYHTPPIAVSALFAGLLTKVGVYALIRAFSLIFVGDLAFFGPLLIIISALTMLTGVLGAASQYGIRKILSWHIISQIGYMTLGLGLFTQGAIAAAIFYIVHHIIVKTNLFFLSGAVEEATGTDQLKKIGGLYKAAPLLSLLFLIPAMSLGGIPPLSGFFAKFSLVSAGFDVGAYVVMGIALFVGILTLFSMTKIWAEAFWKASPQGDAGPKQVSLSKLLPIGCMAAVTLFIGFYPEPLLKFSQTAATQVLQRSAYIEAVLLPTPR